MLQPENAPKKYEHLFVDIDCGRLKIPKFQREFIWAKEQTAKLIDSIIKGFPIGTFILWKTKESFRHYKNIGNAKLPATRKGDFVWYVLDGQQRITSLYAVRKGLIINRDGQEIDYKDITIDLDLDPEEDEGLVVTDQNEAKVPISVHRLLNERFANLMEDYSKNLLEKIEVYKQRLTGYDFSTIVIPEYPLDLACEVFTRINTGGTELSLFEIMVAKTYDQKKDFDLAWEYEWLINNQGAEKDLEDAKFDTIPNQTVLQCVSAHLCKGIRRKDILKLNKNKFIKGWPIVKEGIFCAVDYLRSHLRVRVSRLIPYNVLLVPFTYFFIRNRGRNPTKIQNKLLIQYFWWASLTNRFSSGQEGKIALDLKRIDKILKEIQPSYRGEEIELDLESLKWKWFSAGDAFCKAILCLYSYFEPKSFESNSIVNLNNDWLKIAYSKNYHHFFPKSYLKKNDYEYWKANSIINITLVDSDLNKRNIGKQAPSKYMKKIADKNEEIQNTMKSHLIDIDSFGIWEDDYNKFIKQRSKRVLKELKKRLEPKL